MFAQRPTTFLSARAAWLAVALSAIFGCSQGDSNPRPDARLGIATVALTEAPADLACLEIVVSGGFAVENEFDTTPGQGSIFQLIGLPTGAVTVTASGFGTACASVIETSAPTYVSDPVATTLTGGEPAAITLAMRGSGELTVSVDFPNGTVPGSTGGVSGGGAGGSTSAGTGGSGGSGGDATASGGSSAGSGGSSAGSGGDAGAPAQECTVDDVACSALGLCKSGSCSPCTDLVDDATCAAAYGEGTLCIAGSCVVAECRHSSSCDGQICDQGQCRGCVDDAECTDPTQPFCDVPSGNCSAPPACASAGEACGEGRLCCGATLSCQAVECCTDANCAGLGADYSCRQNACVKPVACPDVTNHTYYVDPAATGNNGHNGSSACPFLKLRSALKNIEANGDNKNDAVTVVIRSDLSEENQGADAFPITVPGNITIKGFSNTTRPSIVVPEGKTGLRFTSAKPGGVTQLKLRALGTGIAGAGIVVRETFANSVASARSINITRMTAQSFHDGIRVEDGGFVTIGADVTSRNNTNAGLLVRDAYARITVGASAEHTYFQENMYGIHVGGASILLADGGEDADGDKTIHANANSYGVRFLSSLSSKTANGVTIANLLSNVGMNNNSGYGGYVFAVWELGAGLHTFGGSSIQVRNCRFKNNHSGVQIDPDDTNNSMAGIDLGQITATNNDPGRNEFVDNTPNLLIGVKWVGSGTLNAAGNSFSGDDCSAPSNYTLTWINPPPDRWCGYGLVCRRDIAFKDWQDGVGFGESFWSIAVNKCKKGDW